MSLGFRLAHAVEWAGAGYSAGLGALPLPPDPRGSAVDPTQTADDPPDLGLRAVEATSQFRSRESRRGELTNDANRLPVLLGLTVALAARRSGTLISSLLIAAPGLIATFAAASGRAFSAPDNQEIFAAERVAVQIQC